MAILSTLYLCVYRWLNLFITFLERVREVIEREQRKLSILLSREREGVIATQTPEIGVDGCCWDGNGEDTDLRNRFCQITSTMIPLYSRSEEVGPGVWLFPLDLEINSSVSLPWILRERVLLLVRIRDRSVHFTGELFPSFETTTTNAVGL